MVLQSAQVSGIEKVRRQWQVPLIVAFGYALAVSILNDLNRGLEWDEAIYLTSALLDRPEVGFGPHRARGIVLAALPMNIGAQSTIFPLRLWTVMLHSAAIASVVWIWQTFKRSAVIGVVLIASTWLALFYGAELSPNLLTALMLIAALGALINALQRDEPYWRWVAFGALTFAVLLRPSDATFWAMGLIIGSTIVQRWRSVSLPVTGALVFGWLPWLVEAELRFGGAFARLRAAAETVGTGPTGSGIHHLALLDGPLIGPDSNTEVSAIGVVWIVVVAVGATFSVIRSNEHLRPASTMLLIGSAAVGAPYLLATGALAPRFLLPMYAGLIMAAALWLGDWDIWDIRAPSVVGGLVLCGVLLIWHVATVISIDREQTAARRESELLGEILAMESNGHRCAFASQYGYPQIEYYSQCDGSRITTDAQTLPGAMERAIESGDRVFGILWRTPTPESVMRDWNMRELVLDVDGESRAVWLLSPSTAGADAR